ncbi:MAG: hypothetical protein SGPRY_013777, partial [Prymnesium sp.]
MANFTAAPDPQSAKKEAPVPAEVNENKRKRRSKLEKAEADVLKFDNKLEELAGKRDRRSSARL